MSDGTIVKGGTSGSPGESFIPNLPESGFDAIPETAASRSEIDPTVSAGGVPLSHSGGSRLRNDPVPGRSLGEDLYQTPR